jgi:hypothetical protein
MSEASKDMPEFINLLDFPEGVDSEISIDKNILATPEEPQAEDNIEAAMGKIAETLTPTRKTNTGSKPGEPAQRQVLIRASVHDHERWKKAAEAKGMALSELIRELANNAAAEALDCLHPREFRKTYKWSDTCTKCNTRLR